MTAEEVLQIVLEQLDTHDIPYMVSGSFASNLHGVPRATQGADIVIVASPSSLTKFLADIQDTFYADSEVALEELQQRRMFNTVHLETGFKIDFIIRKARPFSEEEFKRRRIVKFLGKSRWFSSPEDTILTKLEWSQMTSSERQFTDAVNIAKIQGKNLDLTYLQHWASELNITATFNKLLEDRRQT